MAVVASERAGVRNSIHVCIRRLEIEGFWVLGAGLGVGERQSCAVLVLRRYICAYACLP